VGAETLRLGLDAARHPCGLCCAEGADGTTGRCVAVRSLGLRSVAGDPAGVVKPRRLRLSRARAWGLRAPTPMGIVLAKGAKALFCCMCPPTIDGVIVSGKICFHEAAPPPHVGATTRRRRSARHAVARSHAMLRMLLPYSSLYRGTAANTPLRRAVRHPRRVLTGGTRAFRLYMFIEDRSRLPVRHGHVGRARRVHGMVYSLGSPEVRDRQTLVIIPTYNERDNSGPLVRAVLAVAPALHMSKDGHRA